MTATGWEFIEDLPRGWQGMASLELRGLAGIWEEQRERLEHGDSFRQFRARLCREWAVETGIIEGLYQIDRGTTQLLIERELAEELLAHGSTNRPPGEVIRILRDQQDALEGLFAFVSQQRELSTSYVKEIHAALTRHQPHVDAVDQFGTPVRAPVIRGDWKRLPNNPTRPDGQVHTYCPPEQVASEMDRLVAMHHAHTAEDVAPEVEAAWLHHRFTQIHPFQDGNGRVARALASLIFLRAHWFPLVVTRDNREEYIRCLESADDGDLQPLVSLFVRVQKRAFVGALSIARETLRGRDTVEQIIAAAREKLDARRTARYEDWVDATTKAEQIAAQLVDTAAHQAASVVEELNAVLPSADPAYRAQWQQSGAENSHWFRYQIIQVARRLGYFADTRSHSAWVRVRVLDGERTDIVITFHSLGPEPVGLMAASAFLERREWTDEDEPVVDGPHPLCSEVFQFAHTEEAVSVKERFGLWLEQAVTTGLAEWQRRL